MSRALLAAIFFVLRRAAEHGERVDFATLADFGIASDDGVRMYLDAIAKGDIGADDRKGANLDAAAQFCVRIDRR